MNANLIEYTDEDIENDIDSVCDEVTIGNLTYSPGWALKQLDRVAFDCWGSELPERWECDECKKIHDSEEDAEECCKPEE